jgi:hypothetical protein
LAEFDDDWLDDSEKLEVGAAERPADLDAAADTNRMAIDSIEGAKTMAAVLVALLDNMGVK